MRHGILCAKWICELFFQLCDNWRPALSHLCFHHPTVAGVFQGLKQSDIRRGHEERKAAHLAFLTGQFQGNFRELTLETVSDLTKSEEFRAVFTLLFVVCFIRRSSHFFPVWSCCNWARRTTFSSDCGHSGFRNGHRQAWHSSPVPNKDYVFLMISARIIFFSTRSHKMNQVNACNFPFRWDWVLWAQRSSKGWVLHYGPTQTVEVGEFALLYCRSCVTRALCFFCCGIPRFMSWVVIPWLIVLCPSPCQAFWKKGADGGFVLMRGWWKVNTLKSSEMVRRVQTKGDGMSQQYKIHQNTPPIGLLPAGLLPAHSWIFTLQPSISGVQKTIDPHQKLRQKHWRPAAKRATDSSTVLLTCTSKSPRHPSSTRTSTSFVYQPPYQIASSCITCAPKKWLSWRPLTLKIRAMAPSFQVYLALDTPGTGRSVPGVGWMMVSEVSEDESWKKSMEQHSVDGSMEQSDHEKMAPPETSPPFCVKPLNMLHKSQIIQVPRSGGVGSPTLYL